MLTNFTAVPVSQNLVRLVIRLSELNTDEHKDLLETMLLHSYSLPRSLQKVDRLVEVAQDQEGQR